MILRSVVARPIIAVTETTKARAVKVELGTWLSVRRGFAAWPVAFHFFPRPFASAHRPGVTLAGVRIETPARSGE